MRVLLCGYHEAGYRALRTLVAHGHDVLVATHEAMPGVPDVADLAHMLDLPVAVDDFGDLHEQARRFQPDMLYSVYYRDILPPEILSIPRIGALNFHPSLLPRHRGCFSAPWTIIEGDRETGVTCHVMTERVDAGDVVDRELVPVASDETGMSLYYRLVDAALRSFERVLAQGGRVTEGAAPQEGSSSYHSRKIPFGGEIDPSWSRDRIERFIRALYFPPYLPATVMIAGRRYEVRTLGDFDRLVRGTPKTDSPLSSQPASVEA